MTTLTDRLGQALRSTGTIVAGITDDQWAAPTPCADWDVRAECNHLVGGMRIFTGQLTGQFTGTPVAADHDRHDWLGADAAASYGLAAAADDAAWRTPAATATVFDLAFGQVPAEMALVVHLTEVIVHGLDLAVATGQEDRVDQSLAAFLHDLMSSMGTDAFRVPGIFGAAVPCAGDEPAHRRLLAYLGRDLTRIPA